MDYVEHADRIIEKVARILKEKGFKVSTRGGYLMATGEKSTTGYSSQWARLTARVVLEKSDTALNVTIEVIGHVSARGNSLQDRQVTHINRAFPYNANMEHDFYPGFDKFIDQMDNQGLGARVDRFNAEEALHRFQKFASKNHFEGKTVKGIADVSLSRDYAPKDSEFYGNVTARMVFSSDDKHVKIQVTVTGTTRSSMALEPKPKRPKGPIMRAVLEVVKIYYHTFTYSFAGTTGQQFNKSLNGIMAAINVAIKDATDKKST